MPQNTTHDGAAAGYKASDAMKSVLGNAEEKPSMRADEMTAYLEAAPDDPQTYDDAARHAGKLVLHYLRAHPDAARLGAYELDDAMEHDGVTIYGLGLTGFMWGWAVNAARRCLELDSVPNPAILVIGERDGE